MQAPPRKNKGPVLLKSVLSAQNSYLLQKHAFEVELLEDIRTFMVRKVQLEKEHNQAISKLASQFLQKRESWNFAGLDTENEPNIMLVWRNMLEEKVRLAKTCLQELEYLTTESDILKSSKQTKVQEFKKTSDWLKKVQSELLQSAAELSAAEKCYIEDETSGVKIRTRWAEADSKLKKKKTGLFTSKQALQKVFVKLDAERVEADRRATLSRNNYLLALCAVNAHSDRYRQLDIISTLKMQDISFSSVVRQSLGLLARKEVEACFLTGNALSRSLTDIEQIKGEYNWEYFLSKHQAFSQSLIWGFNPVKDDKICAICESNGGKEQVAENAEKWSKKLSRLNGKINALENDIRNSNLKDVPRGNEGIQGKGMGVDVSLDEAKESLHVAQVSHTKLEARLHLLRDQCQSLDIGEIMLRAIVDEHSECSSPGISEEDQDSLESANSLHQDTWQVYHAMYDYNAQQDDELSFVTGDVLDVRVDATAVSWFYARHRVTGLEGLVPENFLSKERTDEGLSCWCRALYDYEALSPNELFFREGDVIYVTRRDVNGVDDGFWEGYLVSNGNIEGAGGLFPSLLVEVLDMSVTTEEKPSLESRNKSDAHRLSEGLLSKTSSDVICEEETVYKNDLKESTLLKCSLKPTELVKPTNPNQASPKELIQGTENLQIIQPDDRTISINIQDTTFGLDHKRLMIGIDGAAETSCCTDNCDVMPATIP